MQPDPLLQGKSNSPEEETISERGLYMVGLTESQINAVGLFYNNLYDKVRTKKHPRHITRNALTMLRGSIFALGSKDDNVEWKEHASSSLRETMHEWWGEGYDLGGEFREFYPASPKAAETETYKNLKDCYGYFSGIGHHNASGIMGNLISLKKDATLKLEDCYKDEIFIETVKLFFTLSTEMMGYAQFEITT